MSVKSLKDNFHIFLLKGQNFIITKQPSKLRKMWNNADDDNAELNDRIKELEAQLKKEKEKNKRIVSLKVSEKGAVQINGIRRFPITLYRQEMEQILEMKEEIEDFIRTNESSLKTL
jgi:hypothetical protein